MALKFRLITICLMAIPGMASAIDVSKQGNSTMDGTYFASPYSSKGSANPYTDESGYVNPYRSYPGPAYSSPSWPQSGSQASGKSHKLQPDLGTTQSKSQAGAGTTQSKSQAGTGTSQSKAQAAAGTSQSSAAASAALRQAASTSSSQTRAASSTAGQGSNRPALDANGLSRPSVLKESDKIGTTKVQP
ncbi:MAG: hypothetical protein NFW16_11880 [Candidatus Accumulibacter sp.]|uniref:hypothetical protein n=1 Tax=Accumulibacter sp. TaxID=2053492 RepID=UPI002587C510|nr:hypothetical protein [Accumulibacter sp.]MCM8622404.1 hypothetical protein [Accumulibacter sp.]